MNEITTNPSDDDFRAAARTIYGEEGKIEIDDDAVVSRGDDDGAYVQAWVWVYSSDAESASD
ncbi:MAG: hypothetical protein R3C70_07125 [Geminicoccaceae bacterium]